MKRYAAKHGIIKKPFFGGLVFPPSWHTVIWGGVLEVEVFFLLRNKGVGGCVKSPFFKDTAVSGRYRRVLFSFPSPLTRQKKAHPLSRISPASDAKFGST